MAEPRPHDFTPITHAQTAPTFAKLQWDESVNDNNNGLGKPRVQFDSSDSGETSDPPPGSTLSERGRRPTGFEAAEARFLPHKYLIRRPRPLQVEYRGKVIKVGDSGKIDLSRVDSEEEVGEMSRETTRSDGSESATSEKGQERTTDDVDRQRERLDLFVDLIWVGIISNLSENFFTEAFAPDATVRQAIQNFVILFIPAWQLWIKLQLFLNTYYMDDGLQRIIIFWILTLGVAWGNVAPYGVPSGADQNNQSTHLIAIYVVALGSLSVTEFVYSMWAPWGRRMVFWNFMTNLPASALWTAAICTGGTRRLDFMWAAIAYERFWTILSDSPIIWRWLGDSVRKAFDRKHIRKRYENFFIIALGEGVFLLIRKSPLGSVIGVRLARGILALLIYFCLHSIYFAGDQAKTSVHPVHRRWYLRGLWQFLHLPIFAGLVLLSSGILYLVDYTPEGESNGIPAGSSTIDRREDVSISHFTLITAIATAYTSLSFVLLGMFFAAILAKPLDPPKTLIVDNRYLRLAPRLMAVVALATMWLAGFTDPTAAIGWMALIVYLVMVWEWYAGMERGGGFLEPKHD